MNNPEDNSSNAESSFSGFVLGLTLGIVGTLLLSTEEGRRVSQNFLNNLGKTLDDNFFNKPKQSPKSIPEHVSQFEDYEAPPRPHPHVKPGEYFTGEGL